MFVVKGVCLFFAVTSEVLSKFWKTEDGIFVGAQRWVCGEKLWIMFRHELNNLNEVEINEGDIISSEELLICEEFDDLWYFACHVFLDNPKISTTVAFPSDGSLKVTKNVGDHIDGGSGLGILSKELWSPFVGDVFVDWHCLSHLEISINEIWKIWEIESKGRLN